jgi:ferredoxin
VTGGNERRQYLLGGESLVLDQARCNGCGRCEEVCPHAVILVVNGKASVTRRAYCMQCGACRMNCPVSAIEVSTGVGCAAAVIGGLRRGSAGDARCECS